MMIAAEGGALKSISEMGAMLTMFTTGVKPGNLVANSTTGGSLAKAPSSEKSSFPEDNLVMDTKLKIIDILQFILDVRLDYRISSLLSIFKRQVDNNSG